MFKHIVKITFRNYKKNLIFTLIIVSGLAISIATIMVIARYVIQEYSTDKFHKEFNNIFLVLNVNSESNTSSVNQDWARKFTAAYPEVRQACRIDRIELTVNNQSGPIKLNNVLSTDPGFFTTFSFPLVTGDTSNLLKDPHSVILTESIAGKLFGKEKSVGKTIKTTIGNEENLLTVAAVVKDPPESSRIKFEALVSFECSSFHFRMMSFGSHKGGSTPAVIYMCDIYLLIHEKADIRALNDRLKKESYKEYKADRYFSYLKLQPYSEVYFDKNQTDSFKHGDKAMLFVFMSLAVLLLLLACINYINLTTIKAFSRAREIAYKKVSGASGLMLTGQFLFESTGLSVLAFICASGMIKFMANLFGRLVNSNVDVSWFFRFPQIIWVFLFSLVLGMISGYYPAWYLSRIKTSELFKGRSFSSSHLLLLPRNLFIFQFTIAIALIISAIIIQNQLKYINNKNLGFDKNHLLHITIPSEIKPFAMKDELLKNPGINNVTLSYGIPGNLAANDGNNWFIYTDTSFLSTFRITLSQGRGFSQADKNVCLVNETLLKENKWEDYKGRSLGGNKIIGVVKDFHTSSLFEKIVPLELDFNTSYLSDMTIRIEGENVAGVMDYIKTTWKRIAPYSPFEYYFYDDWFDKQYRKEVAFGSLISVFTFIAILISCLGLFGLLAYLIERRAREIGIRKINGANNFEIIVMLNRDFAIWVGISFILAVPLAWVVLYKWLENFAYKTGLNWWFFAIAGLIAMGIALVTVSWKSWLAAARNPAEVIREE